MPKRLACPTCAHQFAIDSSKSTHAVCPECLKPISLASAAAPLDLPSSADEEPILAEALEDEVAPLDAKKLAPPKSNRRPDDGDGGGYPRSRRNEERGDGARRRDRDDERPRYRLRDDYDDVAANSDSTRGMIIALVLGGLVLAAVAGTLIYLKVERNRKSGVEVAQNDKSDPAPETKAPTARTPMTPKTRMPFEGPATKNANPQPKPVAQKNFPVDRPVIPPLEVPPFNRDPFDGPPVAPKPMANPVVYRPVAPWPIVPAETKGDITELPLPASVDDVCLAGGGRFLVLLLGQQKKLALFDASEARIVHYFPAPSSNVKIAAGMDKLFVIDPDTNLIQRWSLRSREKEVTIPLPDKHNKVDGAATGYGAAGPILIGVNDDRGRGGQAYFIDPETLKEVTPNWNGRALPGLTPYLARASYDGKTFVVHDGFGGEPHALKVISIDGSGASIVGEVWPAGASIGNPSLDGRSIHTAAGVFTPQLKAVGDSKNYSSLPARHGPMSIRLQPKGDSFRNDGTYGKGAVTFHLPQDDRVLAKLDNVEGVCREEVHYGSSKDRINHDKRVHYIPGAKLLVTIPTTNVKLLLHRFDFDEAVERSGIDYLYVASTPKTLAGKGLDYQYALAVKSKKGGVKYKLESGPKGMTAGADGKIAWQVPRDFSEGEADVLLTISDATGQEMFHSFKILVRSPQDLPPDAPVAPPVGKDPVPARVDFVSLKAPPTVAGGPFGMKPPEIDKDPLTVALPGAYTDFCLGGGGRYFLFLLKSDKRVAVFDVNTAKVVKYLPMPEEDVRIAAGADKLFVFAPTAGAIQRFSLTTFEKEATLPFAPGGKVRYLCMGSAAVNPLLAIVTSENAQIPGWGSSLKLIDTATLKEMEFSQAKSGIRGFIERDNDEVRVSADGKVFTSRSLDLSPQGIRVGVLSGKELKVASEHDTAGVLIPNEDGSIIYSSTGTISREAKKMGNRMRTMGMRIPSVHGRFEAEFSVGHPFAFESEAPASVQFYYQGIDKPLLQIGSPAQGNRPSIPTRGGIGCERRVHIIPSAKVVVLLPGSNDKLVLHKADLEEAAEKAGVHLLAATSTPPAIFEKGKKFSYALLVKSTKGGAKARLDSGPTGMRLNADGTLTWDVPASFDELEVPVIVTLTDDSKQEVFHNFTLRSKP